MPASTKLLIAIPGLIWPMAGLSEALDEFVLNERTLAQALPGLTTLMGQATWRHEAPCSLDVWLANQFGLTSNLPFAALRLAGISEPNLSDDTVLLCADPVSLRFARQHLLLDGPETLELQQEELNALMSDLSQSFADIGHFFCTTPEHGYLALDPAHADKLGIALAPLPDVLNRPVAQFQPKGEHAAWWSKLANELQVFCHNHPVNTAREARRAPALNSLWLWGLGRMPAQLTAPALHLAALSLDTQPTLKGLARLAQKELEPFNAQSPAEWTLVDSLLEPAQHRDAATWAQALQKLDGEVFVPLAQQLRSGAISQISLMAPGDTALTHMDIHASPRWKFWARGATKIQLLAALTAPSTDVNSHS